MVIYSKKKSYGVLSEKMNVGRRLSSFDSLLSIEAMRICNELPSRIIIEHLSTYLMRKNVCSYNQEFFFCSKR